MAKLIIDASVGRGGINNKKDIFTIQKIINQIGVPLRPLMVNGVLETDTQYAIDWFQKNIVGFKNPDGLISPRGRTFRTLSKEIEPELIAPSSIAPLQFPLRKKPIKSYKTGPRKFGSNRSNGARLHAGCDLYAPKGEEVLALKDGKVLRYARFYQKTYAIEVDHGNFIARYCEIFRANSKIRKNAKIQRGQVIGNIGELVFKSGTKMSMLHIEMYAGKAKGRLSRKSGKYRRRLDLINPTHYLDKSVLS